MTIEQAKAHAFIDKAGGHEEVKCGQQYSNQETKIKNENCFLKFKPGTDK